MMNMKILNIFVSAIYSNRTVSRCLRTGQSNMPPAGTVYHVENMLLAFIKIKNLF